MWAIPLEIDEERQATLTELLAEDERRRAGRFLADEHRRRFIACRGRVRVILGRYLQCQAEQLRFSYSGLGKPALAEPQTSSLAFNVSHSGELALLAVGADGEALGADVERRRDVRNMQGLAQRFFSSRESSGLFQLSDEPQREAFFRIWTRKEAILKATGKGLTFPLDRLTVSFGDDEPPRLLALGDDPEEANRWTLQHLTPAPDYIAAVATRYQPKRTLTWRWRDE